MLQALYKGKVINSFDIKNEYGKAETDIYEEYRKASSKGLITCSECGSEVYLKAGKIRIPHFAHKDSNRECYHKTVKESIEQKEAKMIIYNWLKNQYDNVYIDKRYGNRRANVSLELKTGVVAIQYMRNERDLNEWDEKRKEYEVMGIKALYFFGNKLFDFSTLSKEQFSKIVQRYSFDNTIKVLDIGCNKLTLMRYIDFRDGKGKLYYDKVCDKSYDLLNIHMSLDGNIISDFDEFYKEEYEKTRNIAAELYRTEKYEQQKRLAEEKSRKRLIEEIQQKKSLETEKQSRLEEKEQRTTTEEVSNFEYISEKYLENEKYFNPEGLSYDELDTGVKEFIINNMDHEQEWWFGKHKKSRLIKCKYCGKYFDRYFCVVYQYHSGTCNNCDTKT